MKLMNTPIRIKITDIVGSSFCVSSDDGGSVFAKLNEVLNKERDIELDFIGIDMVISAFFNAAIGRLVEKYTVEQIRNRIQFTNLSEEDQELLERVLENAVRYYDNPGRFREALEIDSDENQ